MGFVEVRRWAIEERALIAQPVAQTKVVRVSDCLSRLADTSGRSAIGQHRSFGQVSASVWLGEPELFGEVFD
ncbi:hypothetical protein ASD76_06320 [Altererythrobacter sp. Root672]|nr:hypothetical protein ASD76_06320 [Altererythrobacter sp. Root672]